MTLKATLRLLLFFGLTGCNQALDKQAGGQTGTVSLTDKEVFSLYKKVDSVIHVARALETGSNSVDLHLYNITTSIAEIAKQRFVSVEHLTRQELDSRKDDLQGDYT